MPVIKAVLYYTVGTDGFVTFVFPKNHLTDDDIQAFGVSHGKHDTFKINFSALHDILLLF